jgi:hypothetical protein
VGYLDILRSPQLDLEPRKMPSLRAIVLSLGLPNAICAAAALLLPGWLWRLARRLGPADSLVVALPIAMPHCYVYDAVVPLFAATASVRSCAGILAC